MDANRSLLHEFRGTILAVAVAVGILVARQAVPSGLVGVLVATIVVGWAASPALRHSVRPGDAAWLLLFSVGALLRTPTREPTRLAPQPLGQLVSITGRVIDVPLVRRDTKSSAEVRFQIEEVDPTDGAARRFVVRTRERESTPSRTFRPGDQLRVEARFFPARGARNPGEIDFAHRRRIAGTLTVPDVAGLERIDATSPWRIEHAVGRLRERLHRSIESIFSTSARGLVLALVLGDRRLLPPRLRENLIATGTYHFLAISGLHVAIVMAWMLRLPLPRAGRTTVRLTLLAGFVLLTGGHPPVVRAALSFAIHVILSRIGRRPHALNTLGWTAIVLIGSDPLLLFEAGFQLSFAAVATILLWTGPLLGQEEDRRGEPAGSRSEIDLVPVHARSRSKRIGAAIWRPVSSCLAASTAALAGTAPVAAYHFQRLHPLSPLWTLLVYPLALVVLCGGWIVLLVEAFIPASFAGRLAAIPVEEACAALTSLTEALAEVPASCVRLPRPGLAPILVTIALLALGHGRRWRRGLIFLALAALTLLIAVPQRGRPTRLIHFDVGAASATLLELENDSSAYLIDAGISSPVDARRLVDSLLCLGHRRLRGVFLSHAHRDHVGALPALLEALDVSDAYVTDLFDTSEAGRIVVEQLRAHDVRVHRVARGDVLTLAEDVRIEIVFPASKDPLPRLRRAPNESSLGFRLVTKGESTLFLGDLEELGLARLLSARDEHSLSCLRADVLVLPHHGRRNKLLDELIQHVRPDAFVISGDGRGGAVERLETLRQRGFSAKATWENGAVIQPLLRESPLPKLNSSSSR